MYVQAHARAVGQLVLAALFWSLGGLLIKAADWPPLAIAGGRGLIAAAFLVLCSKGLRFTFSRDQVLAAVAYAACSMSFVTATKLTTAANAILIQYTAPVWVALFGSWFLGERATRTDWLTILLVLLGMVLFFADGLEFSGTAGNLAALFSGVAFAAMAMLMRKQKDGSPVESIILGNLISFAVGLPFMFSAPLPSPTGWAVIIGLGIFQLGISYWLYAKAIKHVSALEAVIIPVVEPILNPLWVFLARGERPSAWALLGGLLVLGAVTWRALGSLRAGQRRAMKG